MRVCLIALCALLLLTACRSGPTRTPHPNLGDVDWQQRVVVFNGVDFLAPDFSVEQEKNERTREQLQQPVSCFFQSADFSKVLGHLREQTGLNFMVNWPMLEIVGIVPDSPVTIGLDDVPAERILRYTVAMASAKQFDEDKAGYEIIDGMIYISTLADLRSHTLTRVYHIRPLQNLYAPDIRLLYDGQDEAIEYARTLMGELIFGRRRSRSRRRLKTLPVSSAMMMTIRTGPGGARCWNR